MSGGPGSRLPFELTGLCFGICTIEAFGMSAERHVKLFRNGRNQAGRIPREFELPGHEAIMRKEGGRLVIEPAPQLSSLVDYVATIEPEGFPEIEDRLPEPVDLG